MFQISSLTALFYFFILDIVYQASSPDEGALVKGALVLDYIFTVIS